MKPGKNEYEETLSQNITFCQNDNIVLQVASQLGAFIELTKLNEGETTKLVYADEKVDGTDIINIYAFINLAGNKSEKEHGLIYIKYSDIAKNKKYIPAFISIISSCIGTFDKVAFIRRFPYLGFN